MGKWRFGTTTPAPAICDPSQAGDFPGPRFGGGGFGGGGPRDRNPLVIDEHALQKVPATTGGTYYRGQNAGPLQQALADLPSHITVTHKRGDIADWFAGIGGVLVAVAIGLSLWWNPIRRAPASRRAAPPETYVDSFMCRAS